MNARHAFRYASTTTDDRRRTDSLFFLIMTALFISLCLIDLLAYDHFFAGLYGSVAGLFFTGALLIQTRPDPHNDLPDA